MNPLGNATPNPTAHFTTRRAFVASAGFGGLSLYGLWAAYGAAPGPRALLGLDHVHESPPQAPVAANAHAGHGASPHGGPDSEAFSRMAADFAERFRMPDGSVYPRRDAMPSGTSDDPHAGHLMATPGPIDVLMTAGRWYYLPNTLRLDVGQAYRFRMMAMDITHGASLQFGSGARMMRLTPGRIAETELIFERAGRYLMHCTVFCGEAHDVMQATLEVV